MSVPMSKPMSCPPAPLQHPNGLPTPPVMMAGGPIKSCPPDISCSPPKAPPITYATPLGTRWAKEKAAAGGAEAFDLPTDPKRIGPWVLGECVGKGASGRVKIAKHAVTGQLAAVKILPIAPLQSTRDAEKDGKAQAKQEKQRLGVDREITMMKLMDHPNIMRIYDVYEGARELFLVLEYVAGGELFDFLVNRGRLPPLEALIYFRQIIYGLNYAHTFSIIHRDLKPENILIHTLDPPIIKIADWGMAAFAPPTLQLETSCGSPHYASPEIVNGEKYQGNATDIWSCGVILFALLTGRLPFDDKNVRTLLSKVKSGKFDMPSWIDPLAKDLLSRMLVVDVNQRITIPDILAHPWMHARPHPHSPSMSMLSPSAIRLLNSTPPFPPSPSKLALPLPSPSQVDSELLASLQIIWGRHADKQGECIVRDLCAPAGEGTLAKAFYFLLGTYRENVRKAQMAGQVRSEGSESKDQAIMHVDQWRRPASCVVGLGKECELAFGDSAEPQLQAICSNPVQDVPRPYVKRASTIPGPVPMYPPRYVHPTGQYSYTPHPQAPVVNSGAYIQAKPTANQDPKTRLAPPLMSRTPPTISGLSRNRPPSPVGPRPPTPTAAHGSGPGSGTNSSATHDAHFIVGTPLTSNAPTRHQSKSSPTKRPVGPRRGYTYSHPSRAPAEAPRSSVMFPSTVKSIDHSEINRGRPASEYRQRQTESASTIDKARDRLTPPVLPPVVPPRMANEELQRAIDEISVRVNEMASKARPVPAVTTASHTAKHISSSVPLHSHFEAGMVSGRRNLATQSQAQAHVRRSSARYEDKENQASTVEDEGWSYVQVAKSDREVKGDKDRNEKGGGTKVGIATRTGPSGKQRPPALEFAFLNGSNAGNMAPAVLGSPIVLSSPISALGKATPSFADPGGQENFQAHVRANTHGQVHFMHYGQRETSNTPRFMGVSSPVVGEFKGWFSNLFHWKNHTASVHDSVLESPTDYFSHRVGKNGGPGSSGGSNVLHAFADVPRTRLDVGRILGELGVVVERDPVESVRGHARTNSQAYECGSANASTATLRCRVGEAQPALKSMRFRVELSGLSPYLHWPPPQLHAPLTVCPDHSSSSSAIEARPRSGSTPSDSSSSSSAADRSYFVLPPSPCRTAIMLVQEKGSTTAFKTIWRALRDELGKLYGPAVVQLPDITFPTPSLNGPSHSGQWLTRPALASPMGSMPIMRDTQKT